ncbi:tyrosine-type recombinase/integrase [Candidatus Thiosymbion oneisti]|uniref:tyrosine-type recombinase/integrase n=1 Tax=Candidatus Thiosymbion oneisti TaxID=589554 RepID=UPI000A3E381F|nr:site-specific integrase [Candidatus Thiosymbion oneisti]
MGKLTACKAAIAGPGKHEDGAGLRLVVSRTGSKKWVLRYTIEGKRREMGLGGFPDVSLGEARDKATEHRKQAKAGVDPIEARAQAQAETEKMPTFTTCAAQYIREHRHGWRNIRHARTWPRSLKTYAAPIIGSKPVDKIDTEDVLAILKPIWISKTETAKRVQGRVENILDYAAAHGYRDQTNPARWRGHLDQLLPRPSRIKQSIHYPAMPYEDLPAFMVELAGNPGVPSLALQFLILTVTRTSETLKARWEEIDLEARTWTIPESRMKSGREHRVPLSDAVLDILEALPRIHGNLYLFPGMRQGRPLSNMALLQLMRGMGYGVNCERGNYVPHGFRSSFRDWSGEVSSFPRNVAEMALAYVIENKVEAAYRRGDLFAKRAWMMQAWAEFVTKTPVTSLPTAERTQTGD